MAKSGTPTGTHHPSRPAPSVQPIQTKEIVVRTGRLVCYLLIQEERYRYSSKKLAAYVLRSYPDLRDHTCVNHKGNTFEAVIASTSIVHLLEHIAISEQVRISPSKHPSEVFVGTSEWEDEARGQARLELSFVDDLCALHAFNKALRFLNEAVISCIE